jgi:anti-sigma B factor antagonist
MPIPIPWSCASRAGRVSPTARSLKDFIAEMIRQGKRRFVLDFTALRQHGQHLPRVLAGAALELRKADPAGNLTLARVGERNLELIRNLGLHRLAIVDAGGFPMDFKGGAQALDAQRKARSRVPGWCWRRMKAS